MRSATRQHISLARYLQSDTSIATSSPRSPRASLASGSAGIEKANGGPRCEGGQVDALLVQALYDGRKAETRSEPDDGPRGDAAVPQINLSDRRALLPHFWRRRAGREPRCSALDEEGRDARRAAHALICARPHREQPGDRGTRDVALIQPIFKPKKCKKPV